MIPRIRKDHRIVRYRIKQSRYTDASESYYISEYKEAIVKKEKMARVLSRVL